MARTKTTPNPPPPRVHYKALYSWASDELLDECTKLTTIEDVENHLGDLLCTTLTPSAKPMILISLFVMAPLGSQFASTTGLMGESLFFPLPSGIQTHWPASSLHDLREGVACRGQCGPCPTTSKWLGLRKGLSNLVWVLGHPTVGGRFSSLLQSEKAREKTLGELFWGC